MSRTVRPLLAVVMSLSLSIAALVATEAPAGTAVVAPWRWARVDQTVNIPAFSDGDIAIGPCPAGYIALTGGWHSPNNAVWLKRHYSDHGSNYVLMIHNWTPDVRPVYPTAWCAHADDVGPIIWMSDNIPEVNNRAGGTVVCPDNYGVVAGGADWFTFGDRHVDFSGPTPAGDGWFASGTSAATNDTLAIEAGCVPNALLAGEQVVTAASDVASNADVVKAPMCPAGTRVLTGGGWAGPSGTNIRDITARGSIYRSVASTYSTWSAAATVTGGSRFTAIVLCIPQSIPNVAITQVPPALSTSSSGTFTFTASDPAGESLQFGCSIGGSIPCSPGSPVGFGPLSDGPKTLQVSAVNAEGRSTFKTYDFTIDTTPPTVTNRSPLTTAGLTETFTMQFSEPVAGVNGTTLQLFAEGAASPVPGTVEVAPTAGAATSATWTPTGRLMPGQHYAMQFGPGIHDAAGHALTPPAWLVRANPNVDSTSPAVVETWDPDNSTKASGGHYITSRTVGSSARLAFTAPASGEVSLYGIRLPSGGYGDVYLDGVHQTTASFYAASLKRERVYHRTGLTPGTSHTLEVRVLGTKPAASHGPWVTLDSVSLGTTVKQEAAFKQAFRRVTDGSASGGSFDTIAHTSGGDTGGAPAYVVKFRGTSVTLRAVLGPTSGKAAIYVDGVLRKTVDLHAAGPAFDSPVFTTSLSDGIHTVKVVALGTASGAGSSVGIDRFVVG